MQAHSAGSVRARNLVKYNYMAKALSKEEKIKSLLKSREKIKKRIKDLKSVFQEEKELEESWPGHASTRYQLADSDLQVLLSQLELIEKALKELGYKE